MRWRPRVLDGVGPTFVAWIAACTSAEIVEPSDPAPTPTIVESEPSPSQSETMQERDGPEYFFAVLGQTGIEHCPDGMSSPTWLDVQPTLGFVTTTLPTDTTLEPLLDRPVLARGRSSSAPERPPLDVEPIPCPMMQMRSDWINTPRGIRVQRGASPAIEYFHATSVRALDELAIELVGDELLIRFQNPLPFALTGVQLRLHYEGCYGKPGTTARESDAVALAPGEALSQRFAMIAEQQQPGPRKGGPPARYHRAAALELVLDEQAGPEGATVHGQLAVSLHELGIDFDCP